MPEGLLLVVWTSIGLWVMGSVGLWIQSLYSAMGWVEEIGPTDNSTRIICERISCHYALSFNARNGHHKKSL